MDRRDEELQTLAEQVIDSLKQLPQDGQERQITISVGGNNHGSIHVGSVVNINHAPKRPPELHERDSQELLAIKRGLLKKRNGAKWRRYFNIPFLLMLSLLLIGLASCLWIAYMSLWVGGLTNPSVLNEKMYIALIIWGVIMAFCVKFLDSRWKIENRIINENQDVIDTIDVILRRRNY
ncbi:MULTISPECIES: hypothetical protein [unclassified Brenneria]|uniref:hypothetical protein n=1 Tax=unclassified Brenneria TaxID=2634434 RepID=UPI0029C2034D|nr:MULTISPECIES: hypothetical protein [unclassified Brenneria]MDX5630358.1 hypothetical protein [Brenneria sp. L3-3Z]MDX5697503.1 hypothetical protein [Brenneria sp. L4-2C]